MSTHSILCWQKFSFNGVSCCGSQCLTAYTFRNHIRERHVSILLKMNEIGTRVYTVGDKIVPNFFNKYIRQNVSR